MQLQIKKNPSISSVLTGMNFHIDTNSFLSICKKSLYIHILIITSLEIDKIVLKVPRNRHAIYVKQEQINRFC